MNSTGYAVSSLCCLLAAPLFALLGLLNERPLAAALYALGFMILAVVMYRLSVKRLLQESIGARWSYVR